MSWVSLWFLRNFPDFGIFCGFVSFTNLLVQKRLLTLILLLFVSISRAEAETKAKLEKVAEIKKINAQIMLIRR